MRPQLRILVGEGLLREADALAIPSLEAQPVRPGEMPESLLVDLSEVAAQRAAEQSARAGVPIALWLRLAAEAARHIRVVVSELRTDRGEIEAALDAAASAPSTGLRPLRGNRQREYARLLRSAGTRSRSRGGPQTRRIEIAAPDQLIAAWSLDAALAGADLADFISELTLEASAGVVAWEAAAAESGRSLGEWIYAETFALTAR